MTVSWSKSGPESAIPPVTATQFDEAGERANAGRSRHEPTEIASVDARLAKSNLDSQKHRHARRVRVHETAKM